MQNYNEKQLVDRSLLLKMYWDPVGLPTSTLPPPNSLVNNGSGKANG